VDMPHLLIHRSRHPDSGTEVICLMQKAVRRLLELDTIKNFGGQQAACIPDLALWLLVGFQTYGHSPSSEMAQCLWDVLSSEFASSRHSAQGRLLLASGLQQVVLGLTGFTPVGFAQNHNHVVIKDGKILLQRIG